MNYFAHAGHEAEEAVSGGLLDALTHQPVWLSLFVIAFFLYGIYELMGRLRIKPLNRIIAMVPLLILIAIVYLEHNPAVSTVVLSVGFALSFFLAFTMMGKPIDSKTNKSKSEADHEGKPDK